MAESGLLNFEWKTESGRIIRIPIFGGGGKRGLNVKWKDGQSKVSIGITEQATGVIVEHEIGSLEEVSAKINNAIDNGKTTVEEVQEDIVDVWDLIFGPKEEEEKDGTTIVTGGSDDSDDSTETGGSDDSNGSTVTGGSDDSNGSTVTGGAGGSDGSGDSEVTGGSGGSDDSNGSTETGDSEVTGGSGGSDDSNGSTETGGAGGAGGSGGSDDSDDSTVIDDSDFDEKTKISAGLFGGFGTGGKGARPEIGKFKPLSIVNPVAPVKAARRYQRPQSITKSLFSEYF